MYYYCLLSTLGCSVFPAPPPPAVCNPEGSAGSSYQGSWDAQLSLEILACPLECLGHLFSPDSELNQEGDRNLTTLGWSLLVSFAAFRELENMNAQRIRTMNSTVLTTVATQ